MNYLIFTLLCSVGIAIILKTIGRQKAVLTHAITVNYAVSLILTIIIMRFELPSQTSSLPWGGFAILGLLLPAAFIFLGKSTAYAGLTQSNIAHRLCFIVPPIAASVLFHESIAIYKLIGIAIAIAALLCLILSSRSMRNTLLLLGVWLAYGTINVLSGRFIFSPSFALTLVITFGFALIAMIIYVAIQRQRFSLYSLVMGSILGGLNFFAIFFYLKANIALNNNSPLVLSFLNIGIIVASMLVGVIIYGERPRATTWASLALAVVAILTFFYGHYAL